MHAHDATDHLDADSRRTATRRQASCGPLKLPRSAALHLPIGAEL